MDYETISLRLILPNELGEQIITIGLDRTVSELKIQAEVLLSPLCRGLCSIPALSLL